MDHTVFHEALSHLKSVESPLSQLIEQVGVSRWEPEQNAWRALTSSIIGQQISVSAARAIRGRFSAMVHGRDFPQPADLLDISDAELRAVGLSRNKSLSLRDLARHLEEGKIRPQDFPQMEDEEIIQTLLPVRGIGRWTAEMFLLFSLSRPDIFSVGDLGLRNALWRLYGLDEAPTPQVMLRIAQPWRPFRSVASWYLWRFLENQPVIRSKTPIS